MYQISNGGSAHDLVVKFLTSGKDTVPVSELEAFVLSAVAAAWPDSEPVALAGVLRQPDQAEERIVYVGVHAQTYFRSRVAHSSTDPHSMVVMQERVIERAPYHADEALARLNACPAGVLAIGVSAVSPSYMAELWCLLQDDVMFCPAATREVVLTAGSIETQTPTDHGWEGLL